MSGFDFITIDFETATGSYSSACAVGIAAVRDMQIVDTFYSLIQPPDNFFDYRTTKIHGITPEMVANSPMAPALWDSIKHYFDCPMIAHNAYFDMAVLEKAFPQSAMLKQYYLDSMSFARCLNLKKKSLVACAEFFNIDIGTHHNALDDAITCAKFIIKTMQHFGDTDLWKFLALNRSIQIYSLPIDAVDGYTVKKSDTAPKKFIHFQTVDYKKITPTKLAPENSPLLGKAIVFTGELSISREEAMQLAANAGAILRNSISRKTDFLVVGKQDKSIVGDDGLSSKEKKAHDFNLNGGACIKILDEDGFAKLVREAALV